MIYFDNAATTKNKPNETYESFMHYVKDIGTSPGRGTYSLGVQASRMLYQSRKTVAQFFGNPARTNVVFTKNSTEAINLFLRGFLQSGDHVIISCYEHNAVLRPLHWMKEKGLIDYTVIPEGVFSNPRHLLKQYIRVNTKLAAITLASNLTGQIVFNNDFGRVCKEYGIPVFVDASQGGGKRLVDMERDSIDYLAFTGHKDLLAMPGVGGLCSMTPLSFPPLIQGGTGIHGESYVNPSIYPEAYESGTLNMPAIWSLKNSMDYIAENIHEIQKQEILLTDRMIDGLAALPNVIVYNPKADRVPTMCFNIRGVSSSDVVSYLDKKGICVRGGIHCAILAHEALGTVETGAVRISMNYMNTVSEIDSFLSEIGALCHEPSLL